MKEDLTRGGRADKCPVPELNCTLAPLGMDMEMEQFKQHAGIRQGAMQCGSVGQSASCLWFGDSDSEDLQIVSFATISDTFY